MFDIVFESGEAFVAFYDAAIADIVENANPRRSAELWAQQSSVRIAHAMILADHRAFPAVVSFADDLRDYVEFLLVGIRLGIGPNLSLRYGQRT